MTGRRGWNINLLANAETAAIARAAYTAQRLSRIEDYQAINGPYLPTREAAQRLGVSERTIVRYRSAVREGAA